VSDDDTDGGGRRSGDDRGGDDRDGADANHWGDGVAENGGGVDERSSRGEAFDDAGGRTRGESFDGTDARRVGEDVAPWETGVGRGGLGRAVAEVLVTIVVAVIAAGILVVGGVFGLAFATGGEPGTVGLLVASLLGSQAAFALVAVGYVRRRGESIRAIGLEVPDIVGFVLVAVGVVAAFVLAIAAGTGVQLLGLQAAENSTASTASEVPTAFLLLIPIAIFVVGPAEELLFRGVVQRRLREVASAPVAIIGASALFAAVHVIALQGGLAARLTTIAVLFFPAMVFGVLYEYKRNIVVTSLVHGIYDAIIFGALYVASTVEPPSGAQGALAVLL